MITNRCPKCGRELRCVGASTSGALLFETCPNQACDSSYSAQMRANNLAYQANVNSCNHDWEWSFYKKHCKKCGTWG